MGRFRKVEEDWVYAGAMLNFRSGVKERRGGLLVAAARPPPSYRSEDNQRMALLARSEDIKTLLSLVWLIVSNTLDKLTGTATATVTVRSGGQSWLKPCMIWCVRGRRAVVIDLFERKPCWMEFSGKEVS